MIPPVFSQLRKPPVASCEVKPLQRSYPLTVRLCERLQSLQPIHHTVAVLQTFLRCFVVLRPVPPQDFQCFPLRHFAVRSGILLLHCSFLPVYRYCYCTLLNNPCQRSAERRQVFFSYFLVISTMRKYHSESFLPWESMRMVVCFEFSFRG